MELEDDLDAEFGDFGATGSMFNMLEKAVRANQPFRFNSFNAVLGNRKQRKARASMRLMKV